MIIALVGPSGSGKTLLTKASDAFYTAKAVGYIPNGYEDIIVEAVKANLHKNVKPIGDKKVTKEVISHTTRNPRKGEINGIHYHFVSVDEFESLQKYEQTIYNGDHYGLTVSAVEEVLRFSEIAVAVVDQRGVSNIRKLTDDIKAVFIKTDLDVMEAHMIARGDTKENIEKRLRNAIENNELNYLDADFVVDNTGDLAISLGALIDIIESMR
jgi:guanylate kinase